MYKKIITINTQIPFKFSPQPEDDSMYCTGGSFTSDVSKSENREVWFVVNLIDFESFFKN
jgi:hypothetical protein